MSANLEDDLRDETMKWLEKAEEIIQVIISGDVMLKPERFLRNISAYILDSKYFVESGDLIRAFEAVIWAWAWIEIGLEMGILSKELTSLVH